jgi:NAD(P)H dehydrogenase (quinone)
MVAVADVGRTAAELLQDDDRSHRVVELEGPTRTSPADIASALAAALGSPVRPEIVPRETWPERFIAQGVVDPTPRIRMLDGFNEGWIAFENEAAVRHGRVPLADVVRALVTREEAALL